MPAPSLEDLRASREDFGLFCELVGMPRTEFQLEAMRLEKRQTVIVAPRQSGKSETLSLRAAWGALRKKNQLVMIVSASENAAIRLLYAVREVFAKPLTQTSLATEPTQSLVTLTNGSRIMSVPASEKQIRGWSVDLLIVDECAFVADDILLSAAIPTTTARPDAKVVLASTPLGDDCAFFTLAMNGMKDDDAHTRTYRWRLKDAPWIHPAVVEAARASLSPLRFQAEYEGEFVTSGNAFFNRNDVLACVADYPMVHEGNGMPAKCGLDWGRMQDAHAIVLAGALHDYGVNGRPVVVVPYLETSRRRYPAQVDEVERIARQWSLEILTETNGVGAAPSDELDVRLGGWMRVRRQASSQRSKEDYYGKLHTLFSRRGIAIPQHEELIRQLLGITARPTSSGGLSIEARKESVHDDLPDGLALAVAQVPKDIEPCPKLDVPEGTEWAETPDGIMVPLPVRTRNAEPDWGSVYLAAVATPSGKPAVERNPWAEVYGKPADDPMEKFRRMKELN